jgi:hypothetical protein
LGDDGLINKRLVEICDLIRKDLYIPSLGLNWSNSEATSSRKEKNEKSQFFIVDCFFISPKKRLDENKAENRLSNQKLKSLSTLVILPLIADQCLLVLIFFFVIDF